MADHAWCHDVARDAAVRAAEDNRTGPLPTLEEAIARAGQFMWPEAPQGQKCTERESGMRTERVVLEVKHFSRLHADQWGWKVFAQPVLLPGESVRVVGDEKRELPPTTKPATTENDYVPPAPTSRPAVTRQTQAERVGGGWWFPKYDKPSAPPPPPPAPPRVHRGSGVFDAIGDEVPWEGVVAMPTDERDAAIRERESLREQLESVACRAATAETALESRNVTAGEGSCAARAASVGVDGEPVADAKPFAWAVVEKRKDATWCYAFRSDKDQAQREFPPSEFFHFPVYRLPPQPRGWLTKDEREMIGIARNHFAWKSLQKLVDACDELLARSSPPEVMLPDNPYHPSGLREGFDHAIRIARNELVNAGVAVKEVGK